MKKISILGVGWLGEALFKNLLTTEKYQVFGSSRKIEKRQRLQQIADEYGQENAVFSISVPDELMADSRFWSCDVLIVTLPPRRSREEVIAKYSAELEQVITLAQKHQVKHIIYTSSTGVYGNQSGIVNEKSEIIPVTDSAKAVANVEAMLSKAGPRVTILRLAGLYGPNRHPGRWFAGRAVIPNADAPVNLVHQLDVLQAIELVINSQSRQFEVYNVCAASHPSKGQFYSRAIQDYGGEQPTKQTGGADGKVVDAKKIREKLGWKPIDDVLERLN